MNNPVRYIDPSGNRVCEDEYGDCLKQPSKHLTPGELIYRDLLTNQVGGVLNKTKEAVENYMRLHPNYDPRKDPKLTGLAYHEFLKMRSEYWSVRAMESREAGIHLSGRDVYNLMMYYDFHITMTDSKWDGSRVNWASVELDAVEVITSFFGLNEVANSLKFSDSSIDIINALNFLSGGVSVIDASQKNDSMGLYLAGFGFIPGPIGGLASGASFLRGIDDGFYFQEFSPPILR